jgi:hypothetical protein
MCAQTTVDAETSVPPQPVSRDRDIASIGPGHATLEHQRADAKHQNTQSAGCNHNVIDNDIFRMREHVKVSDVRPNTCLEPNILRETAIVIMVRQKPDFLCRPTSCRRFVHHSCV